jgi:REP element-mobilizing transposase RayT
MARAVRHYIPGYVWHITHRGHKREFLLKFQKDRNTWLKWLFQAKKRYGLKVLNYTVTSNHIHLLVHDDNNQHIIPSSIKLEAGCTGQHYNKPKNRKGSFWEGRYHATAVQHDKHLVKCMIYIDRTYKGWVDTALAENSNEWSGKWTESIAAGEKSFVRKVQDLLGCRAKGGKVYGNEDSYQLKEAAAHYGLKDEGLGNAYLW